MWVRCVLWGTSIELGHALPSLTNLSPTSRYWCYPTTSALVFLSFFSLAPPSPSLSCLCIVLLFSIHAHTTSTYFPTLSWIFLPVWWLDSSILTSLFPPHPTSSFVLSSQPISRHRTLLLVLQLSCILSPWLSNLFFGHTESPIPSSRVTL